MPMASMLGSVGGDSNFGWLMEAVANDLTAVGIRVKVRPMERAAPLRRIEREDVQKPGVPGQWGLWQRRHTPRHLCLQQGCAVVDQRP